MPTTDNNISAKIICDSTNKWNNRLTTFIVTYPRIILAEINTHRMFCLAGDSELVFDLPSGSSNGKYDYRPHVMTIKELYNKWTGGSAEHKSPNRLYNDNLDKIDPELYYYPEEICAILGLRNPTNFNGLARKGVVTAFKEKATKRWCILGSSLIEYRRSKETRKHGLRSRLESMKIRQVNEITKEIQHSTIANVIKSGAKKTYTLSAGRHSVSASGDHLIFTDRGWVAIKDIVVGVDAVYCMTQKKSNKKDHGRLLKFNGKYKAGWNKQIKPFIIQRQGGKCSICENNINESDCHIHHIIPVHQDPSRVFDPSNVVALHPSCHKAEHKEQGWQEGNFLTSLPTIVDAIEFKEIEETYDLEISGEFPNFLANGIVVHNSRSTASSRAIPIRKQIEKVKMRPFIPSWIGKSQAGMQANNELDDEGVASFKRNWLMAAGAMCNVTHVMEKIGVHKQIANRLLEPFGYVTTIITATDFANFFKLRCHKDAQPEFMALAFKMLAEYVASTPMRTDLHIPFGDQMEPGLTEEDRIKVACARCARISYDTHDGIRDSKEDIALANKLVAAGHMSPFEHVARANPASDVYVGNFRGWIQYRKKIKGECLQSINYEKLLLERPTWV